MNKIIQYAFVFLIGLALGWMIKGNSLNLIFTIFLPALVTLVAAYFGAKYAFDLQENREKEKEKRKNIVSGNLAIFNISKMLDKLINYQRQVINPVRNSRCNYLEMRPTLKNFDEDISFNINALSFLLGTSHRNLLGLLSTEESRYKTAIDAIDERSRLHVDEVQPALENSQLVQGGNYTHADIENALGSRVFGALQQATKSVVEQVDLTVISLQEVANNLRQAMRELYPTETVIGVATFSAPENEKPLPSGVGPRVRPGKVA